MRYHISLAQDIDKKEWNTFVHSQGTVFHLFEWSKILKETYGYKPVFLYAVDGKGELQGIAPAVRTRNRLISLPFVDYVDILASDKHLKFLLLKYLIEYCKNNNVESMEHYTTDPVNFRGVNYFYVYDTFILNTKSEFESVWKYKFNKKRRNAIRKGLKSGVVIKRENSTSFLREYYRIYVHTMKRIGVISHSYDLFAHVKRHIADKLEMYSASLDGVLIAGLITLHFNDRVHIWNSASRSDYLSYAPNDLLYYQVIKSACERNVKYVDFGSTPLESGLHRFKRAFGGDISPIYIATVGSYSLRPRWIKDLISRLSGATPLNLQGSLGKLVFTLFY